MPGPRSADRLPTRGTTTLLLAERVGPKGGVIGIDLSAPMLEVARTRAKQMRSIAKFVEADATDHPFEPGRYDLAFSQLGVMFFADPTVAFANLRRALRPGGRLALVCWQAMAKTPWMSLPLSAALQHMPPPTPPARAPIATSVIGASPGERRWAARASTGSPGSPEGAGAGPRPDAG